MYKRCAFSLCGLFCVKQRVEAYKKNEQLMKMNRNYNLTVLFNKLSVATKKTVLSTFTRRAQTQAFFVVSRYRLDTKKQVEQIFLSN